jgi:hypothetical protein
MIRVISSPSSSTTGFSTLIFVIGGRCYLSGGIGGPNVTYRSWVDPRPADEPAE